MRSPGPVEVGTAMEAGTDVAVAGVLASRGILLSPAVGAVLMSLGTVLVAVNAQLLRRAAI